MNALRAEFIPMPPLPKWVLRCSNRGICVFDLTIGCRSQDNLPMMGRYRYICTYSHIHFTTLSTPVLSQT